MAAMNPAALWLIIAAVVGILLVIATFLANRNQKKKKNGKLVVISSKYFNGEVNLKLTVHCSLLRQLIHS